MTTALDKIAGEKHPVAICDEAWFRVSARHVNGKVHRAYATEDGNIVSISCSCPGSRSGSLRKRCVLISNGWDRSNCGN